MEITNGSDLILVLHLEDKKGQPLRVNDCIAFTLYVYTTNRSDCLTYTKSQINKIGEVDNVALQEDQLNRLQSGVICYTYSYSVYDPNFEQDMKYDKVKEVTTDIYYRNTGILNSNQDVTYNDLNRVYEKLTAEEDARMAEDYKLAEAINWLNLNACLKGSCSTIKDKDGNIIREFVVADDVAPTYSQEEIDAKFEEVDNKINDIHTEILEEIDVLEEKHDLDILNVFNDAKEYTDQKINEGKEYVDSNLSSLKEYSDQKDNDLKNYADNKFDLARNYVDTTFETKVDAQNTKDSLNQRIDDVRSELNVSISNLEVKHNQDIYDLEEKHNQDIAETLKDSKQYTDDEIKKLNHSISDNYYNREYVDNLENDIRTDINQAKSDANKYTDSRLISYYTREEADNLHSNALLDLNNKLLGYYKKGETDALLEALEAEIDGNLKNYYNKAQVNNLLADVEEKIPTAVSQLDNDLGYLTRHQSLALYAKTADVQNWIKDSEDYAKEYFMPKGDYATVANVKYMIERLINIAPEDLDTLGEIAEKLKSNDDLHASIIDLLRRKANADLVYTKSETDKMFRDALLEIENGFSLELINYFTKEECDARFQPIGNYALKSEIPSLTGYATEQWVRNQNYLTEHQDLSAYALKTYVDQKVSEGVASIPEFDGYTKNQSDAKYQPKGDYLTQIPDTVADKSYVDQKVSEGIASIPEFDGYTKSESDGKYQLKGNYALKSEIPSLDGYATEEWVIGKKYLTEHQSLEGYAKTTEVERLIETKVEDAIQEIPQVDAYTKSESDAKYQPKGEYLTKHQDLSEYAKTEDVEKKIAEAITGGEVDLTSYLTKSEASSTYQPIGDYVTTTTLNSYQLKSDAVKIWSGSQSQYDGLGTYDNNTVYIIIG